MSKRFNLLLPDELGKALERWAESRGDKPTSLANYIVQKQVEEALKCGEIPPESNEVDVKDLSHKFLLTLLSGEKIPVGDIAVLAYLLDTSQANLITLIECMNQQNIEEKLPNG